MFYAHQQAQKQGNPQFERGGAISPADGGFTYGEPLVGDEFGVRPPLRRTDVGSYHTHPLTRDLEINRANENFSRADALLGIAKDPLRRPMYLLTPTLAVRRMTLTGERFRVRTVFGPKLPGEP